MSPATPSTAAVAVAAATAITDNETKRRHQPPQYRHMPATFREDCWSEDETHALIDAWGALHLSLNRGSLRQHQWSDVAAAVNSASCRNRTGVQCKNRMDTLKKRYKIEKAKLAGDDRYVSPWPFFFRLDFLISGNKTSPSNSKSPSPSPVVETPSVASALRRWPVKRRSALRTRPARWLTEERKSDDTEVGGDGGAWRMLAEAIKRVGEVYERVESMKQQQLIELEKHRLQFAMDLEYQRINFFMDTQLHLLSSFKRSKLDHDHPHIDSYL
ncbi:hypothetical protein RND81_11G112700 [Saponaria officinalis]|uniref:Myb-like domain-containing protein n=1 Tax=Saponaria officinalis TaxID=3572 RepID=A0AAW1HKI9_SAPOF